MLKRREVAAYRANQAAIRETAIFPVRAFVIQIAKNCNEPLLPQVPAVESQICSPVAKSNIRTSFQTAAGRGSFRQPHRLTLLWGAEVAGNTACGGLPDTASIDIDFTADTVEAVAGLVGLPPVYLYEDAKSCILLSSLAHLSALPGICTDLDPQGIFDLFEIGYPVGQRTLLQNVRLLAPGERVRISSGKITSEVPMARAIGICRTPADRIERQIAAFETSVVERVAPGTFLSLTGGLDTRAIIAALVKNGIDIPAITISGPRASLDARIAERLCRHYGFRHELVHLGRAFIAGLPDLALEAARLSGGISGLEQAHEVYFCRQTASLGTQRLTGNLGNQLGRWGVEGVRMRGADTALLHADLTVGCRRRELHWLAERTKGRLSLLETLLRHEIPPAFQANFAIGQSFVAQSSPYANCELINLALQTANRENREFHPLAARLHATRHMFLGEPRQTSFQREFIRRVDGFVAHCPINWGWRAAGGLSPAGFLLGLGAFTEAAASFDNPVSAGLARLLPYLGAKGLYEIKAPQEWLILHLKDFAHEMLTANEFRESGACNRKEVNRCLEDHFKKGINRYPSLVAALDLAMFLYALRGAKSPVDGPAGLVL